MEATTALHFSILRKAAAQHSGHESTTEVTTDCSVCVAAVTQIVGAVRGLTFIPYNLHLPFHRVIPW